MGKNSECLLQANSHPLAPTTHYCANYCHAWGPALIHLAFLSIYVSSDLQVISHPSDSDLHMASLSLF